MKVLEKIEIPENKSEKKDISNIARDILLDGKIDKKEAVLLGTYLHEKGKITNEGRQNWRKLSYKIRTDIQDKIGTQKDGGIGPKTINALIKIEEKQEIKDKKNEISDKLKKEIYLYENGGNKTLDEGFFRVSHYNDSTFHNDYKNRLNDDGTYSSNDDGDSFGFDVLGKNKDLRFNGTLSGFTDNNNGTRIDLAKIGLEVSTFSKYYPDGTFINIYSGGGLEKAGNFGMDSVQNSWHKFGGWYENNTEYEENQKATPFISTHIEAGSEASFVGDSKLYIKDEIGIQATTNSNTGTNIVSNKLEGGVKIGEDVKIGGYIENTYRDGMNNSSTINNAYSNEVNTNIGFSGEVGITDNSSIVVYYDPANKITLGYQYKF